MKHTPGPWHIRSTHSGKSWDVGGPDCANVCIVSGPEENGPDQYTANAHLIAAAPALYEALKATLIQLEAACRRSGDDIYTIATELQQARAALALVEKDET